MAIASTETSQAPIVNLRFKIAAFMSFFCSITLIAKGMAVIAFGFHPSRVLYYIIDTSLTIVLLTCSIYILLQLKRLLVERYHFHNMNNLINSMIIIQIYVPVVIFFTRMCLISDHNSDTIWIWVAYGILFIPAILSFGIISIILGKRLLEAKVRMSDLYRIYAILSIIEGACFCVIILAPVSVLPRLLSAVVLGLIFLKESETEPEVEFV